MTKVVVEFVDVVKSYRRGWPVTTEVRALGGVSFRLVGGEVLGVVGPNRSGKTTLAKLLLGLCRPTSGEVIRLGRPASELETLGRVGYVHEHPAFPRYLGAADVLEYFGTLAGVSSSALRARVPALLERVGLKDRAREPIHRFSKGMVQRLGLAQALVNEPELLVLDEPDEGLDLEGRRLVGEIVRERAERGGTVLLISHVARQVERMCDRVAVLNEGRLAHWGPVGELGTGVGFEQALTRLYAGGAV